MVRKKPLSFDVLTAARQRISFVFDNFARIYVSFSGGKDSTAMLHLVADEARNRGVRIGVLFIDWECQFDLTIQHVKNMFNLYRDILDIYWIQLPIMTNNATSSFEPTWKSWDNNKKSLWTRDKELVGTIKDSKQLPFYYDGITFEEFVPLFGVWYSSGQDTACFVGIRTRESLNRWRTIARDKPTFMGMKWTTNVEDHVWNAYPIYDWTAEDVWAYAARYNKPYNELYNRMHQAGMTIHQMRVDEPFGDEARRSLWLYHVIEPKTWAKFISRMQGVNSGALYSTDAGNILGNLRVTLPDGHTWESFAKYILNTMPPKTAEHYRNKIAVYLRWYQKRGYPDGIPDKADYRLEQQGKVPAWRQIVKTLLKNDYWCRNLGFSITKSNAYSKYLELMKRRRIEWRIFDEQLI